MSPGTSETCPVQGPDRRTHCGSVRGLPVLSGTVTNLCLTCAPFCTLVWDSLLSVATPLHPSLLYSCLGFSSFRGGSPPISSFSHLCTVSPGVTRCEGTPGSPDPSLSWTGGRVCGDTHTGYRGASRSSDPSHDPSSRGYGLCLFRDDPLGYLLRRHLPSPTVS